MHVIGHILFGLVIGVIAKFIMPGPKPGGLIATILIGIVGAWLGGLIGRMVGLYPEGHPAGFFMALIGAMLLLFIYGWVFRSGNARVSLEPGVRTTQAAHLRHDPRSGRPVSPAIIRA